MVARSVLRCFQHTIRISVLHDKTKFSNKSTILNMSKTYIFHNNREMKKKWKKYNCPITNQVTYLLFRINLLILPNQYEFFFLNVFNFYENFKNQRKVTNFGTRIFWVIELIVARACSLNFFFSKAVFSWT